MEPWGGGGTAAVGPYLALRAWSPSLRRQRGLEERRRALKGLIGTSYSTKIGFGREQSVTRCSARVPGSMKLSESLTQRQSRQGWKKGEWETLNGELGVWVRQSFPTFFPRARAAQVLLGSDSKTKDQKTKRPKERWVNRPFGTLALLVICTHPVRHRVFTAVICML